MPDDDYSVDFEVHGPDRADLWVRGPKDSQVVAMLMRMEHLRRSAGKAVAACLTEITDDDTPVAWISDVRAPWGRQGAGIGTALMILAMDALRTAGVELVLLDARPREPKDETRLLAFYRKHGFVRVRECAGIPVDFTLMIARVPDA